MRHRLEAWQRFVRENQRLTIYGLIAAAFAIWAISLKISAYREEVYLSSPTGRAETAREDAVQKAESDRQIDRMFGNLDFDNVRRLLRDPDSAQFADTRQFKLEGKRITCGSVNSRNGFGGMAGPVRFAVVDGAVKLGQMSSEIDAQIAAICS